MGPLDSIEYWKFFFSFIPFGGISFSFSNILQNVSFEIWENKGELDGTIFKYHSSLLEVICVTIKEAIDIVLTGV